MKHISFSDEIELYNKIIFYAKTEMRHSLAYIVDELLIQNGFDSDYYYDMDDYCIKPIPDFMKKDLQIMK